MNADDLEPTRMEAAKAAARVFVENQPPTILMGVVAFSSGGLVVQPPTDDQAAVLATIDRLSPQGGTSLGQGIFSSLNAIAGEPIAIGEDEETLDAEEGTEIGPIGHFPSAVVVLLSDGENTEAPDPMEIAQVAADAGVRIFPVGIGSTEGAVVEVDGFNIVTQLNETPLQRIAGLTNGTYYNAEDEESLREIYETIDLQLTVREEKTEVTAIVAGMSILFFLVGGALSLFWFGRVP
jgi:Ca-activated chloride channel family protein